jgi:DNA-binding response OmpR family regulator
VAILDVAMPQMNGIDAAAQIVRRAPSIQVLMLSMRADDASISRALRAGARGYLLKDSADTDLIRAVTAVAAGESFFSPAVASVMSMTTPHLADKGGRPVDALSEREQKSSARAEDRATRRSRSFFYQPTTVDAPAHISPAAAQHCGARAAPSAAV